MSTLADQLLEDLQQQEEGVRGSLSDVSSALQRSKDFLDSPEFQDYLSRLEQTSPSAEENLRLLSLSNAFASELDEHIAALFCLLKDAYHAFVPELEQLLTEPLPYSKTVLAIGTSLDHTKSYVDTELSSSTNMVLQMILSRSSFPPDSSTTVSLCLEQAQVLSSLVSYKTRILAWTESMMDQVAPNVTALVGPAVAAQLIAVAGGIEELTRVPGSNMGLLRASPGAPPILHQCDIVLSAPPNLVNKAKRMVSSKVALAARIDSQGTAGQTNHEGSSMREYILERLERLQDPVSKKLIKPLPVPIEKAKKRRAGKRFQKMKQKYQMTELGKQRNRLAFGDTSAVEDYQTGVELGMVGAAGSGALRVAPRDTQKLGKAAERKVKPPPKSSLPSGMESSLSFTPYQGMELVNPSRPTSKPSSSKYFD